MLLDDDPSARDGMRELFDSVGCSVLTVGTEESALLEIDSQKDIDLVVTDLNLRTGVESDKSGVIFARILRQVREDLPIAAYSTRAKELKLTRNDERAFEAFLDKRDANSEELMKFVHECKALALAHREVAGRLLEKISTRRRAPMKDVEERLSALEKSVLRKEDLRHWLNIGWILFGVAAGLASILGAYLGYRALK